MRAIRIASATLLGTTALTLAMPVAVAEGDGGREGSGRGDITSFGFAVAPSTIAAGGRVTLTVEDCGKRTEVTSGVFDPVTIRKGESAGTATVDRDAEPGAVYEVTFRCGDEIGRTDLTIAGGRPDDPTRPPARHGVKAGLGGTAGGFDPGEIALGAVLVAGSVGAACHWSRRRTGEHDGHGG
ncbi:hypothetical protein [Streptomyces beigongshangae]|uniref:hypothetical protein n=1 Tax=Streptomyces beigongshangae TaxID=2841597 RepID=UPI001C85B3CF|nr:hypothetical protein [Streptomyces sp. REN17]